MFEVQFNDNVILGYEHVPIYASSNLVTGTKYFTKVYVKSNGATYPVGEVDGKLDEEQVKAEFGQIIHSNKERQYATSNTLFRKDLSQVRQRGPAHLNPRSHWIQPSEGSKAGEASKASIPAPYGQGDPAETERKIRELKDRLARFGN